MGRARLGRELDALHDSIHCQAAATGHALDVFERPAGEDPEAHLVAGNQHGPQELHRWAADALLLLHRRANACCVLAQTWFGDISPWRCAR